MPATIINDHFKQATHTALSVKHVTTDKLTVYEPSNLLEVYQVENYCIAHVLQYHMYQATPLFPQQVSTAYGYKVDMPTSKVTHVVVQP